MQRITSKSATLLALAVLPVRHAVAQAAGQVQPNMTICNWAGLRTGLIRDTIYLDGGELWWQSATGDDGQPVLTNNGGVDGLMFTLNLSYPFDTTSFNKTTSLLQPLSKTGGNAGNNVAPNYVDGAMFVNDGELLLYGGLDRLTDAYEPPDANSVTSYEAYQYGPERATWSRGFLDSNLPSNMTRYVSNGAAASVPSENLAFYFSGLRGEGWGPTTTATSDWYLADTLIKVDMSTMRSEDWSNSSIPDKVPPRTDAQLVWVPVGGQGILVAIGGMTADEDLLPAGLNDSQISDAEARAPGFMTSLPVYDIVSQTWYMQNTTGDGPGQLTESCSVVAPANDSSSFNIYVYGGYDGLNETSIPSDDVWILSIPSFTWIKAYSGDPSHARKGHQCERVYPDQMFVIGGVNPNPSYCTLGGPIQVFNLNTLKFQDAYDPQDWSEYTVPDIVSAVIGGKGDGGATEMKPSSSTKALSSILDTPYTKDIGASYPYALASGSPDGSPVPTPVPSGGGLAKWVAPVLGVVLSLVVLSILIVLYFLWLHHKKHPQSSASSSTAVSNHHNRIFGWLNNTASSASGAGKGGGSVTSTDIESDPMVSSPLVGPTEAAGKTFYEAEANEKRVEASEKPAVEMATPWNFENHPKESRATDFAYPAGTSTQDSDAHSRNGSRSMTHGPGPSSPSALVSPQSPLSPSSPSSRPPHHHTHSDESALSMDTAASPHINPYSPEDVQKRAFPPATSTSPTSATTSATPTLQSNSTARPGGGSDGETAMAVGVTRTGSRPAHHRNISSLSSNLNSLSSPESLVSPQDDLRSGGTRPSANPTSDELPGGSSFLDGQSTLGVRRQPTAGKKSSFGEMLDERDEAKEKET